jgi:hypothetical protein
MFNLSIDSFVSFCSEFCLGIKDRNRRSRRTRRKRHEIVSFVSFFCFCSKFCLGIQRYEKVLKRNLFLRFLSFLLFEKSVLALKIRTEAREGHEGRSTKSDSSLPSFSSVRNSFLVLKRGAEGHEGMGVKFLESEGRR